jgi:hypothetical protein
MGALPLPCSAARLNSLRKTPKNGFSFERARLKAPRKAMYSVRFWSPRFALGDQNDFFRSL